MYFLIQGVVIQVILFTAFFHGHFLANAEEVHELEEVVVTAERREESLQKIPMSVIALTGEDLDESAVESTLDLPQRAPGLLFSTNAVLGQPYIRGLGSDFLSIGTESTVAIYKDGGSPFGAKT